METPIDRRRVYDDDAGIEQFDQLEDLERHDGYRAYRFTLEAELERRRAALEQMTDEPSSNYLRGYIAAVRWALQLPQQMRDQLFADIQRR